LRKQRDVDLLFYMDRWQCGKRIGGHSFWAPTDQAQLEPGCPHPLEWSVVVGRPGSPVIWVDY
jgi:hypothetical protein